MQTPALKEISTLEKWNECFTESNETPFFIFKHSTRCSISSLAYDAVIKYLAKADESAPKFILVKVIESRPVSDAIAKDLALEHKSPQLILIKDQKAIWSASHYGVNEERIETFVKSYVAT